VSAFLFKHLRAAGTYTRKGLRELRGTSRHIAGRMIAGLIGQRALPTRLPLESISSVLICRINGRLGNTVMLTPLAKRIHELLPHASIDLALAYPNACELLSGFPGLRRIILFPHKGLGMVQNYLAALWRMRSQRYDLVLDPIANSTSGRVVLSLARARYRVGFQTESQWAPLTHAVSAPQDRMHQALLPVFLLSQVSGRPVDSSELQLTLCLRCDELESGRAALRRAIAPFARGRDVLRPGRSLAFGFFAHATGLKVIEREWWLEFWKAFLELEPDAVPVEFLPSPEGSPCDPGHPSVHFSSLRALTAAISASRMFICADTGPMHLASSTAVPTVALFRASDPSLYGPLKSVDQAINIMTSTPREVAELCLTIWRESQSLGDVSPLEEALEATAEVPRVSRAPELFTLQEST
jgi:heptosyltransferase III